MMHMRFFTLFVLGLLANFSVALGSANPVPVPAPPKVSVDRYILMDHHSGVVLAESEADKAVDPASITKLMTAYVIYKALAEGDISLQDEVLISEKAWRAIGSRMFVEVNTRVRLSDLLLGMIVQSGNDASVALAEHLAGTEEAFAQMMNAEAEALGMSGSHFTNATGLSEEGHYMTARDIAILASAIIREFPEDYTRYSVRKFVYNGIEQYNRNRLLWQDASVDGLKTGHTDLAGYCLASSAERKGMRLISVVLGAKSVKARNADSLALLNYGFRFYETHKLYGAHDPLTTKRVWYGAEKTVPLGVAHDLYITIPRGRYEHLKAFMEVEKQLQAPLAVGQKVGMVRVKIEDQDFLQRPLVVLQAVPEGGIVRKLSDFVLGYFE